jgi:3-phenylpropionate/trans-cinnamate dioxygenase ferredoxin reductase subunit
MAADRRVDVLLIGGGVASVRCARTLRRHGFDGSILLVGEEPHAPYNRPPLTKELLREDVAADLVAAEPPTWYARQRVELITGVRVSGLAPDSRVATLADGTRIGFASCLLATGAAPRHPPIPGGHHAHLLRTLDDSLEIRGAADAGSRAAVIGGGFIGVEAGASLAGRGVMVTIVEMAARLWGGSLGETVPDWAAGALVRAGIDLRLGSSVSSLEPTVALVDGQRLDADIVLAGVGVVPRVELAEAAGIICGDGIRTDAAHATSADGVYAAGDVASVDGLRVEHWHAAREGGERTALAILGQPLPPPRAPWIFSEFAGQVLDVLGHAPAWDDEQIVGDVARGRFAVAYVRDGIVAQLAVANGAIPVEDARRFVESRPPPSALLSMLGPV